MVDAMLADDLCWAFIASMIDSRRRPSPSGGGSRAAGDGGSKLLANPCVGAEGGGAIFVLTGRGIFGSGGPPPPCALIHSRCIPVPRCAPTPALRSSSFLLIRHTIRGHFGSSGRNDLPLKNWTARSRSSWLDRLTKAQEDREIRKIDEGPCHVTGSVSPGNWGAFELKYLQSSSCDVVLGLWSSAKPR